MEKGNEKALKIAVVTVSVLLAVLSIVLAVVIIRKRSDEAAKNAIGVSVTDTFSSSDNPSGASSDEEAASGKEQQAAEAHEPQKTDETLTASLDKIAKKYGASAVQIAIIENGAVTGYYN